MHRKILNYLNYFIAMASCLSVTKNDFSFDRICIHQFFLIIAGPPEQAMWALGNHQVELLTFLTLFIRIYRR